MQVMLPKEKEFDVLPKIIPEVQQKKSGMEIKINNQVKIFPEPCTVRQLLDEVIPEKQKGIAVAVNSSIIPKTHWDSHFLADYDEVLIIKATQGG